MSRADQHTEQRQRVADGNLKGRRSRRLVVR
jgi:hypothetical protein